MRAVVLMGLPLALAAWPAHASDSPPRADGGGGDCDPPARSRLPYVPCAEGTGAGIQDVAFERLGDDSARARLLFCRGVQRLGTDDTDALACFERSSRLRPHALTLHNIAITELQLERYTRAHATAERALERHTQTGELCSMRGGVDASGQSQSTVTCPELEQARSLLAYAAAKLVQLRVRLSPADARIGVDGRPLVRAGGSAATPRFSAGLDATAAPILAPGSRFDLELDPGFHAFSIESKGFLKVTTNRWFNAGEQDELALELERLPATLSVRADRTDAIVQINGIDVGASPVDVQRPPGSYRVVVLKDGFEPYETQVHVGGGESLSMSARLVEAPPPVTKTWWFWTGIGAFLLTSAVIYYVAQPVPAPPPYDGGSTRWVVAPLPAAR